MYKKSLYSALFPYRPRVARSSETIGEKRGREPLEEFLTCALTDILNRLTQEEMRAVVRELLLDEKARASWETFVDQRTLRWISEKRLLNSVSTDGRCDILLEDDEGPLLIIEAKIAAPISRSRGSVTQDNGSNSRKADNQLAHYGNWLADRCRERKARKWRGALVLLTHFTVPPEDFVSGATETYGVPFRKICRWSQVFLWLNQLRERAFDIRSQQGHFLANELAEFLKERGMNAEKITNRSLEVAGQLVCDAHAENIKNFFCAIQIELEETLKKVPGVKQLRKNIEYSEKGVIRSWVKTKTQNRLEWTIEWGLCWPHSGWGEELSEDGISIPNEVFWYVAVFCEKQEDVPHARKLLGRSKELPNSWEIWGLENEFDCGVVTVCGVSEFSEQGNVEDVAKWMCDEIEKIRPVIAELKRQPATAKATGKKRRTSGEK